MKMLERSGQHLWAALALGGVALAIQLILPDDIPRRLAHHSGLATEQNSQNNLPADVALCKTSMI